MHADVEISWRSMILSIGGSPWQLLIVLECLLVYKGASISM